MSKINARTIEEKKKKQLVIIFFILIALLLSMLIILHIINKSLNKPELEYGNLRTIRDVLEYYGCKYISEEDSKLDDFYTDIKLVFKHNLYEEDVSNENYFNKVINDVAKVANYTNFTMIDKENDIDIKVVCLDYKIERVFINGIENYFIVMDSKRDLEKYREIEIKDLQIESPEIQSLIYNNWSNDIFLITRDSIFENYYEYFDEGIKTRSINGKIYNILFNKRYTGNVVNGIFPGVDIANIKAKLGDPTFEDEELNIVGYKGKEIYVFFTKEEISVYRVSDGDNEEFFKLADKLLSEELDLLDFMNELTYLWPDYSEYIYDKSSVFLSYPLKGIDVKIGYDDTNAIVIYNNINTNLTKIRKYLENPEFVSRLKIDNVFEAEKRRVEERDCLLKKCDEYIDSLEEEEKEFIGESLRFGIYAEIDKNNIIMKLCFISKDGNSPNREIYESVDKFLWIDSDNIIYSIGRKGIYLYNAATGQKSVLIRGEDPYILKDYENGILKYDDKETQILY